MDKKTFDRGREIRSSVLGKEFVDNAFNTADEFNRPLQELVTEYCWGAIWGREELSKKDAQHAQSGDDQRAESSARAEGAHQGRAGERRIARRDTRSPAAGGDLLRRAGGRGFLPNRARSFRRAERTSAQGLAIEETNERIEKTSHADRRAVGRARVRRVV